MREYPSTLGGQMNSTDGGLGLTCSAQFVGTSRLERIEGSVMKVVNNSRDP